MYIFFIFWCNKNSGFMISSIFLILLKKQKIYMMKINHFCHQIYCPLRAWSSKRWKYIFGWCTCAERMLRVRHRKSFTVCNVHIISTTSSMELFFNLKFGRTKIIKHGTKIKKFGLNENLIGYTYFTWSGIVIYMIEIVWERKKKHQCFDILKLNWKW